MNEKRVTITYKENGETLINQEGYQGTVCTKDAEKILQAIGGTVIEVKHKPEYYEDGDNPVSVLQQ